MRNREIGFSIQLVLALTFLSCTEAYEKKYYDNGNLKSKVRIQDGVYDGDFTTFYENGNLQSKGEWRGGMGNGFIERYTEEGWLKERSEWLNNLQHGLTELFYEDGSLQYRGVYTRGVEVGEHLLFYKDGRIEDRTVYDKDGNMVYLVKFSKSQEKLMELVFPVLAFRSLGDSIEVNAKLKAPVRGNAVFSVLEKEGEKMSAITSEITIDEFGKTMMIPLTSNIEDLYYRFDYTPGKSDSLASFGYHKKLMPIKEDRKQFPDFS